MHARRTDLHAAILHIDIDSFSWVNDTLGTASGDEVLKEVAMRLQGCMRDTDCIARTPDGADWLPGIGLELECGSGAVTRFGGDEFVVILANVADDDAAMQVAARIVRTLSQPMEMHGSVVPITASIGVAVFPQHGEDEEELLRNASVAMHAAKRDGRSHCRLYHGDLLRPRMQRLYVEAKLRQAVEQRAFEIYLQPKMNSASGELAGAEALLRWNDAELGSVSPVEFIPIAEETGLIGPLGDWVLESVCRQIHDWKVHGQHTVPISINVSARQFHDHGLVHRFKEVMQRLRIEPGELEIEITESALMGEQDFDERQLRAIRELGCPVALDDFGTGYSSLSYLKHLPIDIVKIDRSFVRDILEERDDQAILRAIVTMAHQLRLLIVAEGGRKRGAVRVAQRAGVRPDPRVCRKPTATGS